MKHFCILAILMTIELTLEAQSLEDSIRYKTWQYLSLQDSVEMIAGELEELKLRRIINDLKAVGLPDSPYIEHTAMILSYNEQHEQSNWVMHIITPDIIKGTVFRSNAFFEDPKVSTGSAQEADYFLKDLQPDSTYVYDDFGFDRGHLASSADFRWSEKALSESYFYSNMSPQRAYFNREAWAEVESWLRSYIYNNMGTQLVVFTAPILTDDLPKVKRSVNGVSVPQTFVKVAVDLKNRKGFAMVMPHKKIDQPLHQFFRSIDEVEDLLKYDLFSKIPDSIESIIESQIQPELWIPDLINGNVLPIDQQTLPDGHFNSLQAKSQIGNKKKVTVCGTIVSARYSRSGNLWMNVDKMFPDQVFSVFIREKDLIHFPFNPKEFLIDKTICCYGRVTDMNGTPTMSVEKSQEIYPLAK